MRMQDGKNIMTTCFLMTRNRRRTSRSWRWLINGKKTQSSNDDWLKQIYVNFIILSHLY
jgi:hypothetical protein